MHSSYHQWLYRLLIALVAWSVSPAEASAANFRTCIKWEIETDDSGATIQNGPNAGGTEDHYAHANSGTWATAVGVRIRIVGSGFDAIYDTSPSTGCVDWSDTDGKTYTVTVTAYQENHHGAYVRLHNSSGSCTSWPGSTYGTALANYNPTASGTDVLYAGDGLAWATGQAMLGYSNYRYHSHHAGGDDFAYHVYRDTTANCTDTSNSLDYTGYTHTHHRHCLRLSDCASRQLIDNKFVVAHEMGHAVSGLHYAIDINGSNGIEPFDDNFPGPTALNSRCLNSSSYDQTDVEYNVVGFREGFASFYATRVFNDKDAEGIWNFQGAHDVERYDFGNGLNGGGELENICCSTSSCRDGQGVITDWIRFFWDWYTNVSATCPTQPDGDDMLDLYMYARLEGGLQKDNLFSKMRSGVQELDGHLPSCLVNGRFDEYAVWNGIDNE